MPAEARRLQHRVGDRDRRFFAALACATAIGTGMGAVVVVHGGGSPVAQQCVTRDAVGVLGGGTWRFCGAQALAYCRAHAREDAGLSAQCGKLHGV